ncbi:MAG: GlxA family transcriptional regulator [Pseudomonadota bacterium]
MPAKRIGFVLIDGYALMSTAAAMEPLRAANLFAGRPLYHLTCLSMPGGPARSSLGSSFKTQPITARDTQFDMVFVVAGGDALAVRDRTLFIWLRHLDRKGVVLGGISSGSAILAQAGLMENRRFTIHWHHLAGLRALSDRYLVEQRLYVIDRDRYTCAGGTAPLDMMHAILSAEHGVAFAQRISDWFIQTEIRVSDAPQQASIAARYGHPPRPVLEALALMESHIADPLDLGQIAQLAGLSPRQLQRQFRDALGHSVMESYRNIRLETAHGLLAQSRLSLTEIAQLTGFTAQSHFSDAYRRRYGAPPSRNRAGMAPHG